jgi:site-specific recombinase XerD
VEAADVVYLVLDRLNASSSKVVYARALRDFLAWYQLEPGARFDKATVQRYRAKLMDAGLAPSSINERLCAIRALAQEAVDNHLIDAQLASGVGKVKGVKSAGTRTGNWLTQTQAQALLDAPNSETLKGVRDQAILGVLLGCGLRRSELAALTFDHLQQRDGRWAIVDIVGKGNRVRTVPIPAWTKVLIDRWATAAGLHQGHVFRALRRGNRDR